MAYHIGVGSEKKSGKKRNRFGVRACAGGVKSAEQKGCCWCRRRKKRSLGNGEWIGNEWDRKTMVNEPRQALIQCKWVGETSGPKWPEKDQKKKGGDNRLKKNKMYQKAPKNLKL